jgi:hypothetical protein
VAQLSYNIECTQRLESFTSTIVTKGASFKIYAAAIVSDSRDPNETLEIAKVEPLCPPNTNCALNGTIVTIQRIRPCSQSQGPSACAFKAE